MGTSITTTEKTKCRAKSTKANTKFPRSHPSSTLCVDDAAERRDASRAECCGQYTDATDAKAKAVSLDSAQRSL